MWQPTLGAREAEKREAAQACPAQLPDSRENPCGEQRTRKCLCAKTTEGTEPTHPRGPACSSGLQWSCRSPLTSQSGGGQVEGSSSGADTASSLLRSSQVERQALLSAAASLVSESRGGVALMLGVALDLEPGSDP